VRFVGRVAQDARLAGVEFLRLRQGAAVGARGLRALQHVDDVGEDGGFPERDCRFVAIPALSTTLPLTAQSRTAMKRPLRPKQGRRRTTTTSLLLAISRAPPSRSTPGEITAGACQQIDRELAPQAPKRAVFRHGPRPLPRATSSSVGCISELLAPETAPFRSLPHSPTPPLGLGKMGVGAEPGRRGGVGLPAVARSMMMGRWRLTTTRLRDAGKDGWS
jgi:hypothetical protein